MAERAETERGRARESSYLVDDLLVDLWSGEVQRDGEVSCLSGQPLAILAALLESPSGSLGREELQRRLWPDDPYGDLDQRLNAAVRLLRRALGDSSEEPRYLETVRGRGYRICASVERLVGSEGRRSCEGTLNEPSPSASRPGRGSGAGSRVTRGLVVLASMALIASVALVVAALAGDSESPVWKNPQPGTSVGPAYREYLDAVRAIDQQDLVSAKRHITAALELDADYAAAHVLRARLHHAEGEPRKAEAAFRRALEQDPSHVDAHLGLAKLQFWSQWRWDEAEKSFGRARTGAPGRAAVLHAHAWFLLASRRYEEAASSMEKALELEPMSAVLHSDFGWFQYRMRNYPAALQFCHAALDLEPRMRSALDCRHRALARLGSFEEALDLAIDLSRVPDSVERRLRELPAPEGYRELLLYLDEAGVESSPFVRAMNLAAAEREEEALRQLEVAAGSRDPLLALIDVTPEFDGLVPRERFQAVRRVVKGAGPSTTQSSSVSPESSASEAPPKTKR